MGLFSSSSKKTYQTSSQDTAISSFNTTVDESQSSSQITGLTGEHATALMTVMEAGQTDRAALVGRTMENLFQGAGNSYQQLIGGANQLIQTSKDIADQGVVQTGLIVQSMADVYGQGLETTRYLAQQGEQTISQAAMTARALQGVEESSFQKALPLLAVGLLILTITAKKGLFS